MTKVYIDMDGVLADFNGGLLRDYNVKNCLHNYATEWEKKTPEQKEIAAKVIWAMEQPGFFGKLPVMPGAEKLWTSIDQPYILSAVPGLGKGHDERIAAEKRIWLREVFGDIPSHRIITCLREDKVKYAVSDEWETPNILLDDLEKNCEAWRRAGGYSLLFKDAETAIEDLQEVIWRIYN